MNILLTGGAGFIGSHFCDFIVEKGHKVTVIDDLSTGKLENLALVKDKIQFIKGKLEEVNLKAEELGEFDAIVHLAAQASVPLSIANFEESSKINLLGTIKVLEYCRQKKVPLVYASSSAVYGELELGNDNSTDVNLISPYAADKYVMEVYAKVASEIYDVSSAGLRFFNVYGPRQDPSSPYSGVISIFVDRLLKNEDLHINGGYQTRDFIYVGDIVRFLYKALKISKERGICEQVNLLTGRSISIDELAETLIKLTGAEVKKHYRELPKGDPEKSHGTDEKMRGLFNVQKEHLVTLSEGLKNTLEYIKAQGD